MTDRVINYELLDFTMKYIKTHPERHNQGVWMEGELGETSGTHLADQNVCGTTACFAGWASIFAGYHQIRPHVACVWCDKARSEINRFDDSCIGITCQFEMRHDLLVDETGEITDMKTAATEALGLDEDQADQMFDSMNEREELDAMVNKLHEDGNAAL